MHFQKPMLGIPLDWSNHLNKGCVMHLAMNEGHGDVVRDLSMNGNHGTVKNMAFPPTVASGWNPGQTGVGLKFNGSSDYVDCGNDASLDITDAITVSAWINTPGGKYQGIVGNGYTEASSFGYDCRMDSAGTITFFIGDGVGHTILKTTAIIPPNTWNLVSVSFDNNTKDTDIYFNGVNIKSGTINRDIAYNNIGTIIGKEYIAGNYFNGSIDQFRIQSRAWSAKEVKDYYINPWQVYLDEDDD